MQLFQLNIILFLKKAFTPLFFWKKTRHIAYAKKKGSKKLCKVNFLYTNLALNILNTKK